MKQGGPTIADLHNLVNISKQQAKGLENEMKAYQTNVMQAEERNQSLRNEVEMMRHQVALAKMQTGGGGMTKERMEQMLQEQIKQQREQLFQQAQMQDAGNAFDPQSMHLKLQEKIRRDTINQIRAKVARKELPFDLAKSFEDEQGRVAQLETAKATQIQEYQMRLLEMQNLITDLKLLQQQYLMFMTPGMWIGPPDGGDGGSPKKNKKKGKGKMKTVYIPPQLELTLVDAFVKQTPHDPLWNEESAPNMVAMAFSNSGSALLALAEDGTHRYWQYCPCFACMDPEGKKKGYNPAERLWSWHQAGVHTDGDRCYAKMAVGVKKMSQSGPKAIVVSQNENYLLTLIEGVVFLFNLVDCKLKAVLHQANKAATSIAFHSRDSNIIAVGLVDGTLILTNVQHDHPLRQEFDAHEGAVTSIVFAVGHSMVVTAGVDGKVMLLKLEEIDKMVVEVEVEILLQPTEDDYGEYEPGDKVQLSLNRAGDLLLVSHPNQISVYKLKTLARVDAWAPAYLGGDHMKDFKVAACAFAACGTYIYCTMIDGSVMVFKTKGLTLVCRFLAELIDPNAPRDLAVRLLVPHPKVEYSSCFALALTDGTVQIWKPKKGPKADWEELSRTTFMYQPGLHGSSARAMPVVSVDLDKFQGHKKKPDGGGGKPGGAKPGSPKTGTLRLDLNAGVASAGRQPH